MTDRYTLDEGRAYVHKSCGSATVINGRDFAHLCNPFQPCTGTMCVECGMAFPTKQFHWEDTREPVSDFRRRMLSKTSWLLIAFNWVYAPVLGVIGGAVSGWFMAVFVVTTFRPTDPAIYLPVGIGIVVGVLLTVFWIAPTLTGLLVGKRYYGQKVYHGNDPSFVKAVVVEDDSSDPASPIDSEAIDALIDERLNQPRGQGDSLLFSTNVQARNIALGISVTLISIHLILTQLLAVLGAISRTDSILYSGVVILLIPMPYVLYHLLFGSLYLRQKSGQSHGELALVSRFLSSKKQHPEMRRSVNVVTLGLIYLGLNLFAMWAYLYTDILTMMRFGRE